MTDSPFEDAVDDLRISGSVILHEAYHPPFAVDVPDEAGIRRIARVDPRARALVFHFVRRGGFQLIAGERAPVEVREGELTICAGGEAHRMRRGEGARVAALHELVGDGGASLADAPADATVLICGFFTLRASPANPLLAALPPVLLAQALGPQADPLLRHAAEMLGLEVDRRSPERARFTVARLLEIFFAEAIRNHRPAEGAGWFRGLADPKTAAAIACIHERPGAAWTIESLADAAGLSPSRFAARFRDTVGETALSYAARWRMTLACRMLEESEASIDTVAAEVGYSGAPAFSRAFKAMIGQSPAVWRAERRAAV